MMLGWAGAQADRRALRSLHHDDASLGVAEVLGRQSDLVGQVRRDDHETAGRLSRELSCSRSAQYVGMQPASERVTGVANQFEQLGIFGIAVLRDEDRMQAGLPAQRHSQREVERRAPMSSAIDYREHAVDRPFSAM